MLTNITLNFTWWNHYILCKCWSKFLIFSCYFFLYNCLILIYWEENPIILIRGRVFLFNSFHILWSMHWNIMLNHVTILDKKGTALWCGWSASPYFLKIFWWKIYKPLFLHFKPVLLFHMTIWHISWHDSELVCLTGQKMWVYCQED